MKEWNVLKMTAQIKADKEVCLTNNNISDAI